MINLADKNINAIGIPGNWISDLELLCLRLHHSMNWRFRERFPTGNCIDNLKEDAWEYI